MYRSAATVLLMTLQQQQKKLHSELTALGNVISFSIAELCCYGDMPHTEKKRKLGNIVLEAHYSTVNCNMLNALPYTTHSSML